ncbi:MAG: D-2-hydroxyacid dehydrogenase [Chloroflexi bacterium]|nr:D-2-hydroxyacid dehydrogenase [Chloroflexota bacterium]MDA1145601.1 D-2-hydroxyacid dehydrogenase [Chloroflexota bacterium]
MNILIMTSVTMMDVDDAILDRVRDAAGHDAEIAVTTSPGEALEAAADAEVIFGRIDEQLFQHATKLRWVHASTAGADAYLFPAFKESDVLLSGDKGLVGSHLAETAFGLLLALTRRIDHALLAGPASWDHRVDYRRQEFELEGLTMGIVGFGGTGRHIAKRAAAFGMHCIAVDRDPVPPTAEVPTVWGSDRLDELLATSDVVASGLPLTEDTRDLFDARAFALMKPTSILVNVTRGEVVDGMALVQAIEDGQIYGAALDVAPQEPLPAAHPLWTTKNVVMTPHTAGASQLRVGRNLDRFCRNLTRFRAGEPLEGAIDKELGY